MPDTTEVYENSTTFVYITLIAFLRWSVALGGFSTYAFLDYFIFSAFLFFQLLICIIYENVSNPNTYFWIVHFHMEAYYVTIYVYECVCQAIFLYVTANIEMPAIKFHNTSNWANWKRHLNNLLLIGNSWIFHNKPNSWDRRIRDVETVKTYGDCEKWKCTKYFNWNYCHELI